MKTKFRKSLMQAALVPAVMAAAVAVATPSAVRAQAANPCAPAAAPANPCAPAAAPAAPAPAAAANTDAAPALPKDMYDTTTKYAQAPYGNKMPNIVENYLRATPYIGTGGNLDPTGIPMLKEMGFKTIIDFNTDEQGAAAQGPMVAQAGMAFKHISVSTDAPTNEQVAEFAKIVEDPTNYPILMHCESANRVGAMWALYRASKGVPNEVAVEEGRALGLKTNREAAVRKMLGMPAL